MTRRLLKRSSLFGLRFHFIAYAPHCFLDFRPSEASSRGTEPHQSATTLFVSCGRVPGCRPEPGDARLLLCAKITRTIITQTSAESDAVTGACANTLFSAPLPSYTQHPSSPETAFYGREEIHVYPLSRGFGSERACWIATCFRATGGERKPQSSRALVNVVAENIAGTIHIPRNQETGCKIVHRSLLPQG
jgi:hypothetical protein